MFSALIVASVLSVGEIPPHFGAPLACQRPNNRAFTAVPSIDVAADGRMWATWFCGKTPGEDKNSYTVLATSGDGGETWKEVATIDPDGEGPMRAWDPQVWCAPDGTLRWSWSECRLDPDWRKFNASIRLYVAVLPDATCGSPALPPKPDAFCRQGVALGKPFVFRNGDWGWPVAYWGITPSSGLWVSSDRGKSWSYRGGAQVPNGYACCDEHSIIELSDGRLWCLTRTMSGYGESFSSDGGRTWSAMTRCWFTQPNSRLSARKLKSGNIVIAKHGPMKPRWGAFPDREHLWVAISENDGKTWKNEFEIEPRACSYPDIAQGPDGRIYVVYDHGRASDQEILFASFREEDLLKGDVRSSTVRLARLISKSTTPSDVSKMVRSQATGLQPFLDGAVIEIEAEGFEADQFRPGAKLFADRDYVIYDCPHALAGKRFLRGRLDGYGLAKITAKTSGVLYVLTPEPADNSTHSNVKELRAQGFETQNMASVKLFKPTAPANTVTIYGKRLGAGESITIRPWAVVVF